MLRGITPRPNDEALSLGFLFHAALATNGVMYSFSGAALEDTTPGENGRAPPFNTGGYRLVSIDYKGSTREIPIFMRLLRRQQEAKTCAFCSEEGYDLVPRTAEAESLISDTFGSDWLWRLMLYPEKLGRRCSHASASALTA